MKWKWKEMKMKCNENKMEWNKLKRNKNKINKFFKKSTFNFNRTFWLIFSSAFLMCKLCPWLAHGTYPVKKIKKYLSSKSTKYIWGKLKNILAEVLW